MARRSRVIERDRGWNRISREIARIDDASVKVGVQGDAGEDPETGVSLVLVGWWNEFGTSDGRVPERPFMRNAFDDNRETIRRRKGQLLDGIYAGRWDTERALAILGQLHQAHVQRSITQLRSPPNAPGTIARKGSSNPLIDEGHLRDAIRYEVET